MIEFDRSKRPPREMSIVSMVDVMLVLIIFFMVTGQLTQLDIIPVDPPMAEAGDELNQGPLLIVLGRHDEILINDELLMPQELAATVKESLTENPNRLITVKADAAMKADRLIEVLDEINAAGAENLTIATRRP